MYNLNYKLIDNLKNIAKKIYKNRDSSHDYNHVLNVLDNSLIICDEYKDKLGLNDIYKMVCCSLFHDAWDHKYISSNYERNIIKESLKKKLSRLYFSDHDIQDIFIIIDNISLSKEINKRSQGETLDLKHLTTIRNIVSDADKMEMLGKTGYERFIEFEKLNNNNNIINYDLKDNFNIFLETKINKLIFEDYLHSEYAKLESKKKYDELIETYNLLT